MLRVLQDKKVKQNKCTRSEAEIRTKLPQIIVSTMGHLTDIIGDHNAAGDLPCCPEFVVSQRRRHTLIKSTEWYIIDLLRFLPESDLIFYLNK